MSYDVSILPGPKCPTCRCTPHHVEVGNMTHNVGEMYRTVLPGPYPGGGRYDGHRPPKPGRDAAGLPGISGLRCDLAVPILREALSRMDLRNVELKAMEPDNGWGSFDGARAFLAKILAACEANPTGTLAVNW